LWLISRIAPGRIAELILDVSNEELPRPSDLGDVVTRVWLSREAGLVAFPWGRRIAFTRQSSWSLEESWAHLFILSRGVNTSTLDLLVFTDPALGVGLGIEPEREGYLLFLDLAHAELASGTGQAVRRGTSL
jgi:hypothetical protein